MFNNQLADAASAASTQFETSVETASNQIPSGRPERFAPDCDYAVVGAGPYGLAVAAHLHGSGFDVRIFGKAMDFWDSHMPKGMLLRSPREGSHISDPRRALNLDAFEAAEGAPLPKSMPLETFVRYGQWFQSQALPDLDSRLVVRVESDGHGFDLTLEDGDRLRAANVVVATGIGAFPNRPAAFQSLSRDLVSHTSDRVNRDLGRFAGRRVAVVGAGQSALESAALLNEAGAEVEVLVRQSFVRYLKNSSWLEHLMDLPINPFQAPGKIGPIGVNWLIENPRLFTAFPRRLQDRMAARAIRPAGSSWLRSRTRDVTMRTGKYVVSAAARGERVELKLNDGGDSTVDHVLLGTGYKVAVSRIGILADELSRAIRTDNGYPILNAGFESSVPGLSFIGAPAARSFGPLCRFVAGTPYTATTLAHYARKKSTARRVAMV